MAYQAILNRQGVYRLLLEEYSEGTYVLVFDKSMAPGPAKDYLQLNLAMAKRACEQDFGTSDSDWKEVPNERWH